MKRLSFLIVLAVMLPVLVILDVSAAHGTSADNETITSQIEASNSSTSDGIFGLRIDNINKNGADFYWSTSTATNGSIQYAYTKLAAQYNPQSSQSDPSVLITVNAMLTKSDSRWVRDHHIKVDNLDMSYDPFVQYTIKSATPGGDVYTLSGEFVLVDTQALQWHQTWWFPVVVGVVVGVAMWFLGRITRDLDVRKPGSRIKKALQSRKAKKTAVPVD